MPIVVTEEQVFPLAELPNHVPVRRGGKKLHKSTGFRWKDGLRGIRLETIRVGGTLCTSVQAVQRFFERLSATDAPPIPTTVRTSAARAKQIERAERELTKLGV